MSEITEKAARYRQLMKDDVFQELLGETRERLTGVFLDPSATIEVVQEAHTMVRALNQFETSLQAALDAEAVETKKNS